MAVLWSVSAELKWEGDEIRSKPARYELYVKVRWLTEELVRIGLLRLRIVHCGVVTCYVVLCTRDLSGKVDEVPIHIWLACDSWAKTKFSVSFTSPCFCFARFPSVIDSSFHIFLNATIIQADYSFWTGSLTRHWIFVAVRTPHG